MHEPPPIGPIQISHSSEAGAMDNIYPTPKQAGVRIPSHLIKDRFCAGFHHGLKGGQLHEVEYLRLSFREGFRAAKLYLRQVRRSRGILEFPVRWKVRMKATNN
jgi:hypothetical protein